MGHIRTLLSKFPLLRGMLSYAVIWPCSSLAQEYIEFGTPVTKADWARAARFGVFGAFFMSPVYYGWLKYTQPFFKKNDMWTCFKRAAVEQISYGPFALSYFLFGMSAIEMKPFRECVDEVKKKFWSAYVAGAVYWPATQTINFRYVSASNRIIFVSVASFLWTIYMAHVKCGK